MSLEFKNQFSSSNETLNYQLDSTSKSKIYCNKKTSNIRHGMKINSIVNPNERLTRERYKNSSVRVDAREKNRTRG